MILYSLPLLAYLLGSLSSSILVCKLIGLPDPLTTGSKNPGATNVLRIGGKKAAAVALTGDILKGLLPVIITKQISDDAVILCLVGLTVFLGHLYPIFFKFKGGKGVATVAGVYLGLNWHLFLLLLGIWILAAVLTRYSSIASLTTAASAPVFVYWLIPGFPYILTCSVIALLIFWRHRTNILRLLNGTENRLSLKNRST